MAAAAPKKRDQGLRELYPNSGGDASTKSDVKTDLDIIFVPGLQADAENSWNGKSASSKDFNWIKDKLGIAADCPNARGLLFHYSSAFHGPLKMNQFLDNIAEQLLSALLTERVDKYDRPMVFIGHSMGGLVIAKCITIMDSRRDNFPKFLEATAGCIFFGTPFRGAEVASTAAMFSSIGEKFDQSTASELLHMMKPESSLLKELRKDFAYLVTKLVPKIDVHCFFEELETDMAKVTSRVAAPLISTQGAELLYQLLNVKIKPMKYVTQESACLDGVSACGLTSNHRDLVKFPDNKDERYKLMRGHVRRILYNAKLVAKNRLNSLRGFNVDALLEVTKVLDATAMERKREMLQQAVASSSWLHDDPDFVKWKGKGDKASVSSRGDVLWISGREGRGKTGATIGALTEIEEAIRNDEEVKTGKPPILLAYFFCDSNGGFSTAEELLKSILGQLIRQQPLLISYVEQFIKTAKRKTTLALSMENLWQGLQDVLDARELSSQVYIVVNNLHDLNETSDSTTKLMRAIHTELQEIKDGAAEIVPTKWFFTSRKTMAHPEMNLKSPNLRPNLRPSMRPNFRSINLEDDRYSDQVRQELRNHAKKKIVALQEQKSYKKDLAYFASSLMGDRAATSGWIDVTYSQLLELPNEAPSLRIRQTLKNFPESLDDLLMEAWNQVLKGYPEDIDQIKELLRALALTFEDPAVEELAVLVDFGSDDRIAHVQRILNICSSFLEFQTDHLGRQIVCFKSELSKPHLIKNAQKILSLSNEEKRWRHGEIALRSLAHLKSCYQTAESDDTAVVDAEQGNDTKEAEGSEHADEATKDGTTEDETAGDEATQDIPTTEPDAQDASAAHNESVKNDEGEQDATAGDAKIVEEALEVEETATTQTAEAPVVKADAAQGDSTSSAGTTETKALPYIVKHWLHHASKATKDIAFELSQDHQFWSPESDIRRQWLAQYEELDKSLQDSGWPLDTWTGLHVAATLGYSDLVAALLANKERPDELHVYDSLNNTPLHLAAWFGRPNTVNELIDKGATLDDGIEEDKGFATPLMMASATGNIQTMKKLIDANANINAVDPDMGSVLTCAINSGNLEAVQLAVDKGVAFSFTPPPQAPRLMGDVTQDERFENVLQPLVAATWQSDQRILEFLLEKGADKLQQEDYDKAFVMSAVVGNIAAFDILVQRNPDKTVFQKALKFGSRSEEWALVQEILDKYNDFGLDYNEAFMAAAVTMDYKDELMDAIWEKAKGNISQQNLNDALYMATDREKESTITRLLELGANANATGDEYGNALTAAAYDGTINIINKLLDHGAKVNAPEGWPLQIAAGEGKKGVVERLLEAKADVNACTNSDKFPQGSALQAAVEAGRTEIVEILLQHGADPNLGAGPEMCPIIAATWRAEEDIVKLLLDRHVRLDVCGGGWATSPLIYAAGTLPRRCLELLVEHGADVDFQDPMGDTALTLAAKTGDSDGVEFLLSKNADIRLTLPDGRNALQLANDGAYAARNADPPTSDAGHQECIRQLINHVSHLFIKPASNPAQNDRSTDAAKGPAQEHEQGSRERGSAVDKGVVDAAELPMHQTTEVSAAEDQGSDTSESVTDESDREPPEQDNAAESVTKKHDRGSPEPEDTVESIIEEHNQEPREQDNAAESATEGFDRGPPKQDNTAESVTEEHDQGPPEHEDAVESVTEERNRGPPKQDNTAESVTEEHDQGPPEHEDAVESVTEERNQGLPEQEDTRESVTDEHEQGNTAGSVMKEHNQDQREQENVAESVTEEHDQDQHNQDQHEQEDIAESVTVEYNYGQHEQEDAVSVAEEHGQDQHEQDVAESVTEEYNYGQHEEEDAAEDVTEGYNYGQHEQEDAAVEEDVDVAENPEHHTVESSPADVSQAATDESNDADAVNMQRDSMETPDARGGSEVGSPQDYQPPTVSSFYSGTRVTNITEPQNISYQSQDFLSQGFPSQDSAPNPPWPDQPRPTNIIRRKAVNSRKSSTPSQNTPEYRGEEFSRGPWPSSTTTSGQMQNQQDRVYEEAPEPTTSTYAPPQNYTHSNYNYVNQQEQQPLTPPFSPPPAPAYDGFDETQDDRNSRQSSESSSSDDNKRHISWRSFLPGKKRW